MRIYILSTHTLSKKKLQNNGASRGDTSESLLEVCVRARSEELVVLQAYVLNKSNASTSSSHTSVREE
jgi:hypothetical protein